MKLSAEGKLRLAVKLAFIAGVGTVADSAYAQQSGAAPAAGQPTQLTGVQVTGSRIKQQNLVGTSSVIAISDKELQYQGTVNVESLINNMPQAFAGFSTADSNGATGTATVDLRNLGSQETLVLIDGKRLMAGDPTQTAPSPDLNFIPAALIDRIDILSGGASAVYGSDAVAGVVNFIMKKDFQGFRVDSQLSRTDHSDGTAYDTTLAWGSNFSGGKGNVTLYSGYTKLEAVTEGQRAFSRCALGTGSSTGAAYDYHYCAGSGTIAEGKFKSADRAASADPTIKKTATGMINPDGSATIIPYDKRTFNFAPYNYFQRPDRRYVLGGFAHDQLNKHVDIYGSAMFMDNHTVAAIAPTGIFGSKVTIPCNSSLLSTQETQFFCGDVGKRVDKTAANMDVAKVTLSKRLTALGPRISDLRHTDFRIVSGLRGDIIDGLSYDVSGQHSEVIYASGTLNYLNTQNATNALDVTTNAAGKTVCKVADPNCVPLNLFQLGKVDDKQLAYIKANGFTQSNMVEQVFTSALNADLGKWGVKSPLANDGLGVASGFEYRTETLKFSPDSQVQSGKLGGSGGPIPAVNGQFQVREEFVEAQLPIIENLPGAKLLQIDGAYRLSDYSTARWTHTYKGGLKYAPTSDALFRASFQRATRAPGVNELFTPNSFGLIGATDPCAASALYTTDAKGNLTSTLKPGAATFAQCAPTGVTRAQYGTPGTAPGTIDQCSAGQCNIANGGNVGLKPELSITRSLGIVLTPSMVKNLSVSVDYFDIYLDGAINTVSFSTVFNGCFAGSAAFCGLVHRGSDGTLFGDATTGAGFVTDTLINTGSLRTKGIDVQIDYRARLRDIGLGNNGQFIWNYVSTWEESFEQEASPGGGLYNCVGLYGTTCGTPNPRYRHKLRMTWVSPFGLSLSANWRYFGGVHLDSNTADPNLNAGGTALRDNVDGAIGAKQYLDLSSTYTLPTQARNVTLRFGVSNVTGQGPPTVDTSSIGISSPPFGNANTYPNVYDALGRVWFVGVTADF